MKRKIYKDHEVIRVLQLFYENAELTKEELAAQINKDLSPTTLFTRQDIDAMLAQAWQKKMMRPLLPPEVNLEGQIERGFSLEPGSVHVIPAIRSNPELISLAAARRVAELIRELMSRLRGTVTLGLGAGGATRDFCEFLAAELQANPPDWPIALVAISAGCSPLVPDHAPLSFFNLFPKDLVAKKVGLFAEPLLTNEEFTQLKDKPLTRLSIDAGKEVNIVISSMGVRRDRHDLFFRGLQEAGGDVKALERARWVGNVQYRPYSDAGPIWGDKGELRAVTLFELSDLRTMASQLNQRVILMARQCGRCGRTKARALLPLLRPHMRLFSEVFIDTKTARVLLRYLRYLNRPKTKVASVSPSDSSAAAFRAGLRQSPSADHIHLDDRRS